MIATLKQRPSSATATTGGALASVLVLCAVAGVASGCAAPMETISELPKAPRRPDGVVLDPPLASPPVEDARAADQPLRTLRQPLDGKLIEELVRAYFRAWSREDADALAGLLTPDAAPLVRGGPAIVDGFRTRIRTYEYQRIAGLEPARFDRLERLGHGDLALGARPSTMREGDVLVRVPVLVARVGGDPLFGETLVLLVRRAEDGSVRIAGVSEANGAR